MDRKEPKVALDELERVTASGTWVVTLSDPPSLWWSEGTRCLLGWSSSASPPSLNEAIKMYKPASRKILKTAMKQVIANGTSFDLELEIVTAKGKDLYVRATGSRSFGLDGLKHLAGTVQSIDKQRQAELQVHQLAERLSEFEERWRLATEGSGLGVWDWNPKTGDAFFSSLWKSMLGYGDSEIANKFSEWDCRVHPDDKPRLLVDLNSHLRGETPFYSCEYRLLCKDGRYKWILARGQVMSRTDTNEPTRVVGTHTDIDKQKFLEDVASQVATRYQGIFDSTFQFIGLLSPDGTLLEANKTALNFAGLSPQDVIGKAFWDCYWWQLGAETQDQLKRAIEKAASGETVQYQVKVKGAGDVTAIIDFSLKPVRDDSGTVVMIIPEGRDVSQQVAAQQALDERDRLFRATFDEAPIGTAIVSLQGRWHGSKRCAMPDAGIRQAEVVGAYLSRNNTSG